MHRESNKSGLAQQEHALRREPFACVEGAAVWFAFRDVVDVRVNAAQLQSFLSLVTQESSTCSSITAVRRNLKPAADRLKALPSSSSCP